MSAQTLHQEEDGKTKNDHFREMIKLALERGITPSAVAVISWIKQFKRRYAEHISIYELKWDVVKPAITHNLAQIMYAS